MTSPPRFARKELLLIALGLAVWIAIGVTGVRVAKFLLAPREDCGTAVESDVGQAGKPRATPSPPTPGGSLRLLTGRGRCR